MERARYAARRLVDGPIIEPGTHPSVGQNIQGPSLINVPDWLRDPLGRYYLYFADHKGTYIRLAYADDLLGPWRVHPGGSLQLHDSRFLVEPPPHTEEHLDCVRAAFAASGATLPHDVGLEVTTPHIASPDVHVDHETRRIVMYFHGLDSFGRQASRVATSTTGLDFVAMPEVIEKTYLRVFRHGGMFYGLAMPGQFYRSANGIDGWSAGPRLFEPDMRHCAVRVVASTLEVFWTRVGDSPERVLLSTIDVSGDWTNWVESAPSEVLRPERRWEGSDAPLEPSIRSVAYGSVNQLRDPAIFEESGRTYLLYAVAGESGIAIAELTKTEKEKANL